MKVVHTTCKVYSRNAKKLVFLYYYQSKNSYLKVTFSTKIELVTQACTKIPCVNTEKPMGAQDNFSQSKQVCCKWQTLVGTIISPCTQGNLCIGTIFFD